MPKSKLPPMEFFCPKCDKYAQPDPEKSDANWKFFPPKCPDCGQKWELEWKEK